MRGSRTHHLPRRSSLATRIAHACLTLACAGSPAFAHDSRPLFIELTVKGGARVELAATAPASVDATSAPAVTLEAPCVLSSGGAPDAPRQRAIYDCESGIGGATLRIEWPAYNPSISTLVRVVYRDGQSKTAILDPVQREWMVPAPQDFAGVAKSYFRIGVEHIAGGIDHLLFLAGLLIISGTWRRAIVAVTGFTIAHSLTLALVALGLLRVSVPATEAVIALSIVFLAAEIARNDRTTIAWRRPLLIAGVFGLAHGAGFAAALGEVGLPEAEKVAALLFFNVGVEAGQIAIVAVVFGAAMAARASYLSLGRGRKSAFGFSGEGSALSIRGQSPHPLARRALAGLSRGRGGAAQLLAGYGLGIVSAYWFVERIGALFA